MKRTLVLFLFLLVAYAPHATSQKNGVVPVLENLANYPNVRDFTLSASGDEAYFTILSPYEEISAIVSIDRKSGKWSDPKLTSFSGKYRDLEPFLSPDGLRLYFASNRPLDNRSTDTKDFDLWYVERTNHSANWAAPVNMGQPVNSEHNEFYPSVTNSKNLYFTSDSPEAVGKDDIFVSVWKEDQYLQPTPLSDSINTEGYEFNAFVAPDESFLIFSGYNREDGYGSGDLYICYRQEDGWSNATNLGGSVNSQWMDYCPFVDSNAHMIYFTSKRSLMKQEAFTSIKEMLNEINKYSNGFSRIYKVSVNEQLIRK